MIKTSRCNWLSNHQDITSEKFGMTSKVVLITGASSGIGLATADLLHGAGFIVYGTSRRTNNASKYKFHLIELDVNHDDSVNHAIEKVIQNEGRIDVLINNAGLASGLDKFQDSDMADIEKMINVNIKGLIYVTRELIPLMIERNSGHIINIGSTAGIFAYSKAAVYCATKSAVKLLSDGIRIDTIDTDIKITTVQPGIVETDFSAVRFHGDKEMAKAIYEGIEALKPEDIAEIIVYIANQPKRVQISDITIMANQQAAGFLIHRK